MINHPTWAEALLAPTAVPSGLKRHGGLEIAKRFAIYRNNVFASLIEALADTFPVAKALVGEDFFNYLAADFIRNHPPQSPVLALYGGDFAHFIEFFPAANSVPYLADMARLEFCYVQAFHSADRPPLAMESFTDMLQNSTLLPELIFDLHASLQVLNSKYAICSLWFAHQEEERLADVNIDIDQPESIWILRRGLTVELVPMGQGDCQFLTELRQGHSLGLAAEIASRHEGNFDLTRCLSVLLQKELILGVTTANSI